MSEMQSVDLHDVEAYWKSRGLVDERHAPYYVRWLQRFLAGPGGDPRLASEDAQHGSQSVGRIVGVSRMGGGKVAALPLGEVLQGLQGHQGRGRGRAEPSPGTSRGGRQEGRSGRLGTTLCLAPSGLCPIPVPIPGAMPRAGL